MVSLQVVCQRLRELCPAFFTITEMESVVSTNDVVKAWGKKGAPQGNVLISTHQAAGKGRLGRNFYSPRGTGIYMSLLLRPALSPKNSLLLTTATAVAVANAIGEHAYIKWVNDIYVNDRKVCGILTEAAVYGGAVDFAVVGIGLNIAPPINGFPSTIKNTAGCLFESMPQEVAVANLIARILTKIYELSFDLRNPIIVAEYNRRNWLLGKTVTAGELTGKAVGIGDDLELLVEKDGVVHGISAGEVSIAFENI